MNGGLTMMIVVDRADFDLMFKKKDGCFVEVV
jgi:hypothetical protein